MKDKQSRDVTRRSALTLLSAGTATLAAPTLLKAQSETLQPEALLPVARPEELGFDVARLERLTSFFQRDAEAGQIPGAVVLIARHDKVAYLRALGYQDREARIPMKPDSIFRIASMTKPVVSVAAMMLVEEGILDIAAPVFRYLPEFKDLQVRVDKSNAGSAEVTLEPQRRPMTVQDLMRHTSGLVYTPPLGVGPVPNAYREANVLNRDETLAEMVTKLSKLPLAHQPGEVWQYSIAIDVLGRVIEVASGEDLEHFIESRIAKPLGMDSTGFHVKETDRNRISQPDKDPVTGQRPPLFDPATKPKLFSGGSGLVSTAGDYLRFCQLLMHGGTFGTTRLLAPSTVSLMTANSLKPGIGYTTTISLFEDIAPTPAMGQGFGLGFAVRTEVGQNPLPGSVGSFYWSGAFGTTFYIDPVKQLIIIMMIQVPFGPKVSPYRQVVRSLAYQALLPDK
jgi:CubicO group peptidase (beta-lactamase class C family)